MDVGSMNPNTVAVRVNGRQTPVFVSAEGSTFRPDDFLLFYIPASKRGLACEVTSDKQPSRMELTDARPVHQQGDVCVSEAGPDQRAQFETDPSIVRYFLHGFSGAPVWVVDVTQPTNAVLLAGYAYTELSNGLTAVYLSYEPKRGSANCLAVQDDVVYDVTRLAK
jgi:hypothetical protein